MRGIAIGRNLNSNGRGGTNNVTNKGGHSSIHTSREDIQARGMGKSLAINFDKDLVM